MSVRSLDVSMCSCENLYYLNDVAMHEGTCPCFDPESMDPREFVEETIVPRDQAALQKFEEDLEDELP